MQAYYHYLLCILNWNQVSFGVWPNLCVYIYKTTHHLDMTIYQKSKFFSNNYKVQQMITFMYWMFVTLAILSSWSPRAKRICEILNTIRLYLPLLLLIWRSIQGCIWTSKTKEEQKSQNAWETELDPEIIAHTSA